MYRRNSTKSIKTHVCNRDTCKGKPHPSDPVLLQSATADFRDAPPKLDRVMKESSDDSLFVDNLFRKIPSDDPLAPFDLAPPEDERPYDDLLGDFQIRWSP